MVTDSDFRSLEKRLAASEKAQEATNKAVAELDKRLTALEKTVESMKSMVKNHDSLLKVMNAGSDDKALEEAKRELDRLKKRAEQQEAKVNAAMAAANDPARKSDGGQTQAQFEKLTKQKDQLKATIDAVAMSQTKAAASIEARLQKQIDADRQVAEKHMAEMEKLLAKTKADAEKMIERNYLESRLKPLEALINQAMQLASRR